MPPGRGRYFAQRAVRDRIEGRNREGLASMSDFNRGFSRPTPAVADMSVDAGLRAFMLGVYNKVGLGLVVSAVLAYVTGTVPQVTQYFFATDAYGRHGFTVLGMVVAFAPVAILLFQAFMRRTSPQAAAFTY